MVALSGLVFALSWWLGLYLLARDPRKPVLALAAVGLTSFALVVALDAVRLVSQSAVLGRVEIYLVAVPGIAWLAVLLELSRPRDSGRSRAAEVALVTVVAATAVLGATLAGDVDGPLRLGHWVMFGALSVPVLAALVHAVTRRAQPRPVVGFVIVATLFFALGNAILIIPLGLVPSWVALASTGVDIALLGVAVAIGDAFDEGPSEASLIAELTGDQKAIQQATSRLWELWYNEEGEVARRRLDEAGGMMGSPRTASRAAESLQTLAEEFPSWAEPVNRLATLRFMERKFEESIELCERVLELKPHHFACLSGLTMAYHNNRQARPHPTPP